VLFSTRKSEQLLHRIFSLVRSRHEENVDWQGYLDPHLIESREPSTLDAGDPSTAVEAARTGEERPATKLQRIALELKQLEFVIQKLTRRWIPRLEYSAKVLR
jgi:hypothetical protein